MANGKYGFANLHQPNLVTNVSFLLDEMGLADVFWSWKLTRKPRVLVKVGKLGSSMEIHPYLGSCILCSRPVAGRIQQNWPILFAVEQGARRTNSTMEECVAQWAEGWRGRERELGPAGLAARHWGSCFTCPCATASPTIIWDNEPGFSL